MAQSDWDTNAVSEDDKCQWHPIKNQAPKVAQLIWSLRTKLWDIIKSGTKYAQGGVSIWNLINLINSENHENQKPAKQKFTLALST